MQTITSERATITQAGRGFKLTVFTDGSWMIGNYGERHDTAAMIAAWVGLTDHMIKTRQLDPDQPVTSAAEDLLRLADATDAERLQEASQAVHLFQPDMPLAAVVRLSAVQPDTTAEQAALQS